jgi:5-methylcytosine-specific restriction endonuclease McrA
VTVGLTPAGSSRAWRRLRATVLHRDGHICHWCGAPATHADHLLARSRGGTDDPDNLVAACPACNLSRGAGPRPVTLPASRPW